MPSSASGYSYLFLRIQLTQIHLNQRDKPKEINREEEMAPRNDENAFWTIFGYLLSGLLIWGGIGYGLDRWLGTGFFLLGGLLLGMGSSLYLIWLRFGRN